MLLSFHLSIEVFVLVHVNFLQDAETSPTISAHGTRSLLQPYQAAMAEAGLIPQSSPRTTLAAQRRQEVSLL